MPHDINVILELLLPAIPVSAACCYVAQRLLHLLIYGCQLVLFLGPQRTSLVRTTGTFVFLRHNMGRHY